MSWLQTHVLEMLFGFISAGLIAGFKVLAGRLKKIKADNDNQRAEMERENRATKAGLQALLRNALIDGYDKYMQRGYILVREMENMQSMYSAYHELGGNGTITSLVEQLQRLPHNKSGDD